MIRLGQTTVRYPEENDPDRGGGPIRRSPLVTTRSGDGMPPHGWPQMVLRTPHAVVPDTESGGAVWPGISRQKFLPDGRLVPAGALGGYLGQASEITVRSAFDKLGQWFAKLTGSVQQAVLVAKAGTPIPCDWIVSYHADVVRYRAAARAVIASVKAIDPNAKIVQKVTALDGTTKNVETDVPVLPPTWPASTLTSCGAAQLGQVVQIATKAGQVIAANLPTILKTIAWTIGISAVANLLEHKIPNAAGLDAQPVPGALAPNPPKESGLGVLGWVGLATILVGAGVGVGIYLYRRQNPDVQARILQREEADERAKRLIRQAGRVRRAGRRGPLAPAAAAPPPSYYDIVEPEYEPPSKKASSKKRKKGRVSYLPGAGGMIHGR